MRRRQMAQPQAPVPADQLGRDLRNIQVSPFTNSSNAREWIEFFLNRKTALQIPDDRGCRLLRAMMTGEALDWVTGLDQNVLNNFQHLINGFREKFVIKDPFSQNSRKAQFYSTKQGEQESVKSYASRLRELGFLLQIPQADLKAKFLSSLHQGLRTQIGLHNPPDFDTALALAEEAERNSVPSSNSGLFHSTFQDSALVMFLDKMNSMQNDISDLKKNYTQGSGNQGYKKKVSFSSPRSRSPSPGRSQKNSGITCHFCGHPNHVQATCILKKRAEAQVETQPDSGSTDQLN